MFGFGKNKKDKTDKRGKRSQKELQAGWNGDGVSHKAGRSKKSVKLREKALANAAAARAHIGEDVLDKIAEAMTKKQQSAMEQAKAQIADTDPDRVLDELKLLLDESRC